MSHVNINILTKYAAVIWAVGVIMLASAEIRAEPLGYTPGSAQQPPVFRQIVHDLGNSAVRGETDDVPAGLQRHTVLYQTSEAPGTIIVDTANTRLYYVLGGGKAMSYGIGVGREGFTWSGVKTIERKSEWPDWYPPAEMLQRQPYLPRFMAGGPGNPLGARAMYIAGTIYRIHGTNAPDTIGKHVSSGCIRMLNEDVIDLYNRVTIGNKVVVLPDTRDVVSSRPSSQTKPTVAYLRSAQLSGLY